MVSADRIGKTIAMIKYRGVFDCDGLLRLVYNWLSEYQMEVHESKYKHKVPDSRGAEDEIAIYGFRRTNAYIKNYITADFHFWDMKDVDVIRNGVKQRMTSARMKVNLIPRVEMDFQRRFPNSPFYRGLQDFYHKYIMRKDIENYWEDELYYHTLKLHQKIKEFLDMETKTNASEGRW